MRTFVLTIAAIAGMAAGLPMFCALESHPRTPMVGIVLPCVSIAHRAGVAGTPL